MKSRIQTLLAAAVIVLAGAWIYVPALHGGWIWDDAMYFGGNPYLSLPPGAALRAIWTGAADISYFPITASARWLEWRLWGGATFGYHAANLALHLVGALLFWRLLRKLRTATGGNPAFGAEWLAALVFAAHPVCVESVAWISELKNVLSLPPLLLALSAYVDFDRAPAGRAGPYLRSLAWFVVAMLCKSTVVMLPACLLLYAWWRRGTIARRDLAASAPFFALSLALGLVSVWFEHHVVTDYRLVPAESFITRLAGAGIALVFYLGKAIAPAALIPIYPRWPLFPFGWVSCLPGLALVAASLWLAGLGRRGRDVRLGLGWFVLNLAPMLGLIGLAYLRISRVADHFSYLALLGAAGWGAAAFSRWRRGGGAMRRIAASACAGAAVLALAFEARACAAIYRDEPGFWTATLRRNPDAWLAHYDLGNSLLDQGRLPEAIDHYRAAARLNPRQAEPQSNWGVALVMLNRPAEAVPHLEEAARLDPGSARVENSLGAALLDTGEIEPSVRHFRRTVAIDPTLTEGWANLGRALAQAGRLEEAIAPYREAVRLRPGSRSLREDLAGVLGRAGHLDEALEELKNASRLRRNSGR